MWLFLATVAQAPAADSALGAWLTEDKKGVVQLAPCVTDPNQLCGTIARILAPADPAAIDEHNPNPALRHRAVLGLTIMTGFHLTLSNADCPWQGGKAYDPEDGVTHTDIQICLKDGGHVVLSKALHMGPFSPAVAQRTWQKLPK